jgi:hypothetical protein
MFIHSAKYLTSTPQSCQGNQKQWKYENCDNITWYLE